jgi:hypothetical protein
MVMQTKFLPQYRAAIFGASLVLLSGCQAATTLVEKRELDVQTHMSETIFLDPVGPEKKIVAVRSRNTSDFAELDIRNKLVAALQARGFQVTDDLKKAHYLLQVNILQAGKVTPEQQQSLLTAQYGDPALGAAIGVLAGSQIGGNPYGGALAGGLAGAAIGFAANTLVKDNYYSITTDVQISERPKEGVVVQQRTLTTAGQANSAKEITSAGKRTGASPQLAQANASTQFNSNIRAQHTDEVSEWK